MPKNNENKSVVQEDSARTEAEQFQRELEEEQNGEVKQQEAEKKRLMDEIAKKIGAKSAAIKNPRSRNKKSSVNRTVRKRETEAVKKSEDFKKLQQLSTQELQTLSKMQNDDLYAYWQSMKENTKEQIDKATETLAEEVRTEDEQAREQIAQEEADHKLAEKLQQEEKKQTEQEQPAIEVEYKPIEEQIEAEEEPAVEEEPRSAEVKDEPEAEEQPKIEETENRRAQWKLPDAWKKPENNVTGQEESIEEQIDEEPEYEPLTVVQMREKPPVDVTMPEAERNKVYGTMLEELFQKTDALYQIRRNEKNRQHTQGLENDLAGILSNLRGAKLALDKQSYDSYDNVRGSVNRAVTNAKSILDSDQKSKEEEALAKMLTGLETQKSMSEELDIHVERAKRRDAVESYRDMLLGLQQRMQKTNSRLFNNDSEEYEAMAGEVSNMLDFLNGSMLEQGDPTSFINLESSAFKLQLNKLQNAAAEYSNAKLVQDKNANRQTRFDIAGELMELPDLNQYRQDITAERNVRVTSADIIDYINALGKTDLRNEADVKDFLTNDSAFKRFCDSNSGKNVEFSGENASIVQGGRMVYDRLKKEQESREILNNPDVHSAAELAMARRSVLLGAGIRDYLTKNWKDPNSPGFKPKTNLALLDPKKIEKLKDSLLQNASSVAKLEEKLRSEGLNFRGFTRVLEDEEPEVKDEEPEVKDEGPEFEDGFEDEDEEPEVKDEEPEVKDEPDHKLAENQQQEEKTKAEEKETQPEKKTIDARPFANAISDISNLIDTGKGLSEQEYTDMQRTLEYFVTASENAAKKRPAGSVKLPVMQDALKKGFKSMTDKAKNLQEKLVQKNKLGSSDWSALKKANSVHALSSLLDKGITPDTEEGKKTMLAAKIAHGGSLSFTDGKEFACNSESFMKTVDLICKSPSFKEFTKGKSAKELNQLMEMSDGGVFKDFIKQMEMTKTKKMEATKTQENVKKQEEPKLVQEPLKKEKKKGMVM